MPIPFKSGGDEVYALYDRRQLVSLRYILEGSRSSC